VFVCIVDLSKTFDRVNYWKLFVKLLHDKVNVDIVSLPSCWYIQQEVCVQWHNTVSAHFNIGNGVRRGGVLSPSLFCRYINDLLLELASTNAGCYIGNLCYNVLSYADDLVLCAPSRVALQSLTDVLFKNVTIIDMICNVQKQFVWYLLRLIVIKLY